MLRAALCYSGICHKSKHYSEDESAGAEVFFRKKIRKSKQIVACGEVFDITDVPDEAVENCIALVCLYVCLNKPTLTYN